MNDKPLVKSLAAEERETIIRTSDADDLVYISTSQRPVITAYSKNPNVTRVAHGSWGTTEWAEFTVPKEMWRPIATKRQSNLTEEQRAALGARLTEARNAA